MDKEKAGLFQLFRGLTGRDFVMYHRGREDIVDMVRLFGEVRVERVCDYIILSLKVNK